MRHCIRYKPILGIVHNDLREPDTMAVDAMAVDAMAVDAMAVDAMAVDAMAAISQKVDTMAAVSYHIINTYLYVHNIYLYSAMLSAH